MNKHTKDFLNLVISVIKLHTSVQRTVMIIHHEAAAFHYAANHRKAISLNLLTNKTEVTYLNKALNYSPAALLS